MSSYIGFGTKRERPDLVEALDKAKAELGEDTKYAAKFSVVYDGNTYTTEHGLKAFGEEFFCEENFQSIAIDLLLKKSVLTQLGEM